MMAADDVAQALMLMDDEKIRRAVAEGDLSAAGKLTLDKSEQQLLMLAAADDPELAGLLCNGLTSLQCNDLTAIQCNGFLTGLEKGLARAADYAKAGLSDADLGATFDEWIKGKLAQGGGW